MFFQQSDKEFAQVEVARQKAKFVQDQFGAAQALGIFVIGSVLDDIGGDFVAADQLTLDLVLYRKRCVLAGKEQDFIHRTKEFFRFLRRDFLFLRVWCGAGALARGGLSPGGRPGLRPARQGKQSEKQNQLRNPGGKSVALSLPFAH